MILYHVTTKDNLDNILEHGIVFGTSPFHVEIQKYVYLTDKAGIMPVVMGWVYCHRKPIVIEVDIPKTWLKTTKARIEEYVWDNPKGIAKEWLSTKIIPPEYITKIYEYKCK